jgi:pimeloyl-ACP methyl ester carboxylesterase
MRKLQKLMLGIAVPAMAAAGATTITPARADKDNKLTLGGYGVLYVGGEYVTKTGTTALIKTNQAHVEYFLPANKNSKKLPVIMVHGSQQTGVNFLSTPDGREGWALDFVRQGHPVYVVDQPARGRSVYHPQTNGSLSGGDTNSVQTRFTAPEKFPGSWPQAKYHTQFPGTGLLGDKYFDQFFASQVENASSDNEVMTTLAVTALLDQIGPSILMTHSQSGSFTWPIADARPNLVKGILAIEPSGPPVSGGKVYGVSPSPLTYSPAIASPSELQFETIPADNPDLNPCQQQKEPARQLIRLKKIPTLVVTSEASYHAQYDQCTARYLQQAGVPVDYVRLETVGIRGNGHMMMIEKNSAKISKLLMKWVNKYVKSPHKNVASR